MPYCQNCESHVTEDYVRVFGIDGEVNSCPSCPDRVTDPQAEDGYRHSRQKAARAAKSIAADGGS